MARCTVVEVGVYLFIYLI